MAANYLLTEEQLLCCICLDVFTEPVTLPCGHNFCKNCIMEHLNHSSQRQCPMCKERVDRKSKLGINTFISEMALQFRQSAGRTPGNSSKQHDVEPTQVSVDVPTRPKVKAVKPYMLLALGMACMTLYIAVNLHQTVSSLMTDQLFDNAMADMCTEHSKPLELYCKNEQIPICASCADSSHRFHNVVPLEEEYDSKKRELWKQEADIQQQILERQLKKQEIKHSIKLSNDAADREVEGGVQVFTALIQSLDRARAELVRMIKEKQEMSEEHSKGFIQELEQETSGLMRRRAELEQLSGSKDHLHLLQSVPTLNAAPVTKDWTEVSVCPASYEGITRTVLVMAVEQLTDTVRQEMKKLQEAELKNIQQNGVEVTLDPDTAHPALLISDDGKQVHSGDEWNKLPDNPKRFETAIYVLGKQGFSCGRFYYDVQVKGKTGWTVGVAKGSISRKGEVKLNPENGCWSIRLRNRKYFVLANHPVPLSVNDHLEKVRVFVDYDEGVVSFYDADGAALLHSFSGCSFTEKIFPFFSPGPADNGRNSAPLIIFPVRR